MGLRGWVTLLGLLGATASVSAQTEELPPGLQTEGLDPELSNAPPPRAPAEPLRIVAGLGGGFSIRLVRNLEFQQERFAPSFLEVFGGVVLPGRGRFRHQTSLHIAGNLSGDGNFSFGLDPLEQWTIMPAYTLRIALQDTPVPDYLLYGRIGVPLTVSPDFVWGIQADVGFTYMLLAGFGVYVELGYSMFFGGEDRGGDTSIHPLLSGELGVVFDIEVL